MWLAVFSIPNDATPNLDIIETISLVFSYFLSILVSQQISLIERSSLKLMYLKIYIELLQWDPNFLDAKWSDKRNYTEMCISKQ